MAKATKTAEEIAIDKAAGINEAAEATQAAKAEQDQQLVEATEAQQIDSIVPVTETVAKVDAETAMVIATSTELPQATDDLSTRATATQWRVDEHGRRNHPNDVKFQMKDGTIHVVSTESAELLKNAGEGNIVA